MARSTRYPVDSVDESRHSRGPGRTEVAVSSGAAPIRAADRYRDVLSRSTQSARFLFGKQRSFASEPSITGSNAQSRAPPESQEDRAFCERTACADENARALPVNRDSRLNRSRAVCYLFSSRLLSSSFAAGRSMYSPPTQEQPSEPAARQRSSERTVKRNTSLLDLPDDVLDLIVRKVSRVVSSPTDGTATGSDIDRCFESCVDVRGYARGVRLAKTCRSFSHQFFSSLDSLTLPSVSRFDDAALKFIGKNVGRSMKRLVLRNCSLLSDQAVHTIASEMTELQALDLSFIPSITDDAIARLCRSLYKTLEKLLLRKCELLTEGSMTEIARCSKLRTLDLSYIGPAMSDSGMDAICHGCGPSLEYLAISHNSQLSDKSFASIGEHCTRLLQLCARCLPLVTDSGFAALCRGVGETARGLDVIDCRSLTKDAVVRAYRDYCRHISLIDPENHSLRYVWWVFFFFPPGSISTTLSFAFALRPLPCELTFIGSSF